MWYRDRAKLKNLIAEKFNDEELKSLVFDLGIKWEELPGETHSNKVESLIAHIENHDRLNEMVSKLEEERSSVNWPRFQKGDESNKVPSININYLLLAVIFLILFSLVMLLFPAPRNALVGYIAPSSTPTMTPSATPTLTPSPTFTPTPTPTRSVTIYLINTDGGPQLSLEPFGIGILELIYDDVVELGTPSTVVLSLKSADINPDAPQEFVSLIMAKDPATGQNKLVAEDRSEAQVNASADWIGEIPLYPIMAAQLSSPSDIVITTEESYEQVILLDGFAYWLWGFVPQTLGSATLELTISIPIHLSPDENAKTVPHVLKKIRFPLIVEEVGGGDATPTFDIGESAPTDSALNLSFGLQFIFLVITVLLILILIRKYAKALLISRQENE